MKSSKGTSSRIVESDISDSETDTDGSIHTDDVQTDSEADDDDDLETDQFAPKKKVKVAAEKKKEPESGDEVVTAAQTTNKFVAYGKTNTKIPGTLKVIFSGKILSKPHELNLPLDYTADEYFQYCDTKTNAKYRGLAIQPSGSSEITHYIMTYANCDLEIATKLAGKKLTPQTLLLLANVSNSLNGTVDADRAAMDITSVDQELLSGFQTTNPANANKKNLTMVLSTKHATAIIKRAADKQAKNKERQEKKKLKQQSLQTAITTKPSPEKPKEVVASSDEPAKKKSPVKKQRKRKIVPWNEQGVKTPYPSAPDSTETSKKIRLNSTTAAFQPLVPFFQALMDQMGIVARE